MDRVIVFAILILGIGMVDSIMSAGRFGQCLSSEECGPGQCCVVGMMRYSTPACRPLRREGEMCRPASNKPISQTLWYPNGIRLHLTNSYLVLCPCEEGLTCRRGVCVPVEEQRTFFSLFRK